MTAMPVAPAAAVTHAMKSSAARFSTRSTTDTLYRARVALANIGGTLAMDALSMQRSLVRPVRVAHDPAKVEPVVVRNFAPACPSLVHCNEVAEALARCISQQVCSLQFAITEPRRRPLGLQRIDGNSGFVGDPRQHRSTRRNGAE